MKSKSFGLMELRRLRKQGDGEMNTKGRLVSVLMKARTIGLAVFLSLGASSAVADLEVSASVQIHARADFYAPLTPQGTWVEVGSYGRCWHPAHLAVEWRPYCYGHWVWTDCGWYWESDEPWAWACYHYGYWVVDPTYGWIWVPDVEWAPAWVSWRVGGGYVGWAPMVPPGIVFEHHAAPATFVFVNTAHFGDPMSPSAVIVNSTTVINKTADIGGVKRETKSLGGAAPQRVIVNQGPAVETVQKASGKSFQPTPIREVAQHTAYPPPMKPNGAPSPTTGHNPNVFGQPGPSPEHPGMPGRPSGKGQSGKGDDDKGRGHGHDR